MAQVGTLPFDLQWPPFDGAMAASFSADLLQQFDTRTSIIRNQVFTLQDLSVMMSEEKEEPTVAESHGLSNVPTKEPTVVYDPLADFLNEPDQPIHLFEPIQLVDSTQAHPKQLLSTDSPPNAPPNATPNATSNATPEQVPRMTMLRKSSHYFRQKMQRIKSTSRPHHTTTHTNTNIHANTTKNLEDLEDRKNRRVSIMETLHPPISLETLHSDSVATSTLHSTDKTWYSIRRNTALSQQLKDTYTDEKQPRPYDAVITHRSTLSSKRRSMFCLFTIK
ncbi:hypothetical protein BDF14DRAFT_1878130 [Spinellus fusiger]|nr:hypothetical protein BDF14DRAFT_1878130 [Spinellus fusiger]